MVSHFNIVHTLSNALYDPTALVTQNDGEGAFRILARQGIGITLNQLLCFDAARQLTCGRSQCCSSALRSVSLADMKTY